MYLFNNIFVSLLSIKLNNDFWFNTYNYNFEKSNVTIQNKKYDFLEDELLSKIWVSEQKQLWLSWKKIIDKAYSTRTTISIIKLLNASFQFNNWLTQISKFNEFCNYVNWYYQTKDTIKKEKYINKIEQILLSDYYFWQKYLDYSKGLQYYLNKGKNKLKNKEDEYYYETLKYIDTEFKNNLIKHLWDSNIFNWIVDVTVIEKNWIKDVWYKINKNWLEKFKNICWNLTNRTNFIFWNFVLTNNVLFKNSDDFHLQKEYWIFSNFWIWIFLNYFARAFIENNTNIQWVTLDKNFFAKFTFNDFFYFNNIKIWNNNQIPYWNYRYFIFKKFLDFNFKNSRFNNITHLFNELSKDYLNEYNNLNKQFKIISDYWYFVDLINWLNKIKVIRWFLAWDYDIISFSPLKTILKASRNINKIILYNPFALQDTKIIIKKNEFNIWRLINWIVINLVNYDNSQLLNQQEYIKKIKNANLNLINKKTILLKINITKTIEDKFWIKLNEPVIVYYALNKNSKTVKKYWISFDKINTIQSEINKYYFYASQTKDRRKKRILKRNWDQNEKLVKWLIENYKDELKKEIMENVDKFINQVYNFYNWNIVQREDWYYWPFSIKFCNLQQLININEKIPVFNNELIYYLKQNNFPTYFSIKNQKSVCIKIDNVYLKWWFIEAVWSKIYWKNINIKDVNQLVSYINKWNKIENILKTSFNSIWYWSLISYQLDTEKIINDSNVHDNTLLSVMNSLKKYSDLNLFVKSKIWFDWANYFEWNYICNLQYWSNFKTNKINFSKEIIYSEFKNKNDYNYSFDNNKNYLLRNWKILKILSYNDYLKCNVVLNKSRLNLINNNLFDLSNNKKLFNSINQKLISELNKSVFFYKEFWSELFQKDNNSKSNLIKFLFNIYNWNQLYLYSIYIWNNNENNFNQILNKFLNSNWLKFFNVLNKDNLNELTYWYLNAIKKIPINVWFKYEYKNINWFYQTYNLKNWQYVCNKKNSNICSIEDITNFTKKLIKFDSDNYTKYNFYDIFKTLIKKFLINNVNFEKNINFLNTYLKNIIYDYENQTQFNNLIFIWFDSTSKINYLNKIINWEFNYSQQLQRYKQFDNYQINEIIEKNKDINNITLLNEFKNKTSLIQILWKNKIYELLIDWLNNDRILKILDNYFKFLSNENFSEKWIINQIWINWYLTYRKFKDYFSSNQKLDYEQDYSELTNYSYEIKNEFLSRNLTDKGSEFWY